MIIDIQAESQPDIFLHMEHASLKVCFNRINEELCQEQLKRAELEIEVAVLKEEIAMSDFEGPSSKYAM